MTKSTGESLSRRGLLGSDTSSRLVVSIKIRTKTHEFYEFCFSWL